MERAPVRAPMIKNLELKVGLLLALTLLLMVGLALASLYAKGVFDKRTSAILTAENVDGVEAGMPIYFSGFPIGKVEEMSLTEEGKVRIVAGIDSSQTKWLRHNSQFVLERSLLGSARLRAYTADFKEPPFVDGSLHPLIGGEEPSNISALKQRLQNILDNVAAMTASDAHINRTLGHVETLSERMTGEYGLLQGALGSPEKAREVVQIIEKTNALMTQVNGMSLKVDGMLSQADKHIFAADGMLDHGRQSAAKVNALLGDVRDSLKKADAILASAQAASANVAAITHDVKGATTDIGQLRVEIDDSVRKVNHLINEINKKWPFARDVEIKTP